MFNWFSRPAESFTVAATDDENEQTHGPWNDWKCDDSECICHETDLATDDPIPVPWQALTEKKNRR